MDDEQKITIYHIHKEEDTEKLDYLREISITSPLYSISLTSSFPGEDMELSLIHI